VRAACPQHRVRARSPFDRVRNGWLTTLTYSDATTPAVIAPRAGLLISVKNVSGWPFHLELFRSDPDDGVHLTFEVDTYALQIGAAAAP
jgi:hypothetical protein